MPHLTRLRPHAALDYAVLFPGSAIPPDTRHAALLPITPPAAFPTLVLLLPWVLPFRLPTSARGLPFLRLHLSTLPAFAHFTVYTRTFCAAAHRIPSDTDSPHHACVPQRTLPPPTFYPVTLPARTAGRYTVAVGLDAVVSLHIRLCCPSPRRAVLHLRVASTPTFYTPRCVYVCCYARLPHSPPRYTFCCLILRLPHTPHARRTHRTRFCRALPTPPARTCPTHCPPTPPHTPHRYPHTPAPHTRLPARPHTRTPPHTPPPLPPRLLWLCRFAALPLHWFVGCLLNIVNVWWAVG